MTTLRREIIERSQEVKKRQRKLNLILLLVISIFTLVLFVQIFNHPKLAFNHVQLIDPTGKLEGRVILELIGKEFGGKYGYFLSKRNYYFYPREKLKLMILNEFSKIKNLALRREGNILKVIVTLREPKFIWCHGAENFCQYLDDEGIAISLAPKFSGETLLVFSPFSTSTPLTRLGTSPFAPADFIKLTELIDDLMVVLKNSPIFAYNMRGILALEAGDYKVELFKNGQKTFPLNIYFNLKNSAQTTLSYLKSVFNSPEFKASLSLEVQPLKTLDLRFSQKVFYEFWE